MPVIIDHNIDTDALAKELAEKLYLEDLTDLESAVKTAIYEVMNEMDGDPS